VVQTPRPGKKALSVPESASSILAVGVLVRVNASVTSADIDELIGLAEATSEAAEIAGSRSRFRGDDIQLTAVKETATRLVERARSLTPEAKS